jgi:nitroreductase
MDFLELAKKRYSSRNYKNITVEEDKILNILEAARISPSAANKQPWHFIVVNNPEKLSQLHGVYHREWFREALTVIVVCGDSQIGWVRLIDNKNHTDVDLAIAVTHITLQATEIGLATCWICHFDVGKTSTIFNLPPNIKPFALLTVGYPADIVDIHRHEAKRKTLEDIVHWDNF